MCARRELQTCKSQISSNIGWYLLDIGSGVKKIVKPRTIIF